MTRPPSPLRTAVAIVAGVLFALAAASPASAAPSKFEVKDLGEDLCTEYYSEGEAEWAEIFIYPSVAVKGKASTFREGNQLCLDVVPKPRYLEFVAYSDEQIADQHRIPLPVRNATIGYEFDLIASYETTQIRYVTVAICIDESTSPLPVHDCTEPVVLYPGR